VAAPVETSSCEMPPTWRLPQKSLDISDPPGNHTECNIGADLGHVVGETVDNEAGNKTVATTDVNAAENRMENETSVDMGGDDDDEQEQVEFQYEKIGVHCFAPAIAEAEAAFENIKQVLKPSCKWVQDLSIMVLMNSHIQPC
jgi:hypothetical protein